MTQDQVFVQAEADHYWRRNADHIRDLELRQDIPITLLDMYKLRPHTALEVGAANGYRLQWIGYLHHLDRAVAVEPSPDAIEAGRRVSPWIHFIQATAAATDLQGEQFDLVIVNYVLHWVDRAELLQSITNIDRAVKDGGHLIIGDFGPVNCHANPYKHQTGLFTFKQDYARLFTETGLYHPVAMLSSAHGDGELRADVPEQERYACWLLQKSLTNHYVKGV